MEIIGYSSIDSTNAKAKELAKQGTEPWSVIWAEEQKKGYGRKKESWFSPPGGLYFSIILPKKQIVANNSKKSFEETKLKVKSIQTLTILAAFVVGKVIKEEFGLEAFIKIPNDVWVNQKKSSPTSQKKLAGVLTENVVGKNIKSSVIGIGINTNIESFPPDLKDNATSLKIELGKKTDNRKILGKTVKALEKQFSVVNA